MSKPKTAAGESDVKRELEQLNRRIKTTVDLLADPTFDGIDEIHVVLTDLKRKRDAVLGKQLKQTASDTQSLTQHQLRDWANEQFAKLDEIAKRPEATLADRQLVESFIHRIDIWHKSLLFMEQSELSSVPPDGNDGLLSWAGTDRATHFVRVFD